MKKMAMTCNTVSFLYNRCFIRAKIGNKGRMMRMGGTGKKQICRDEGFFYFYGL